MRRSLKFLAMSFLVVAVVVGFSLGTAAEEYPDREIELVVPYGPGGGSDITARPFAEHIEEYLGEAMVVTNIDGGGGTVGMAEVRDDDTQGYKLGFHHEAMHTAKHSGVVDWGYEVFQPVMSVAVGNEVYVVREDAPWDNLDEFIEDARENPGAYIFGMNTGATSHFKGLVLEQEADIDLNLAPIGGGADRLAALEGGFVDMIPGQVETFIDYIEADEFRALGVMAEERDPQLPDVPTMKEQGYDIDKPMTYGIFGPEDMPQDRVDALNEAMAELAEDEEFQEAMSDIGRVVTHMDDEEFAEYLQEADDVFQELAEIVGF